ncbi:MAG: hypothetical protein ACTJHU_05850 [Mycetocola sp.]
MIQSTRSRSAFSLLAIGIAGVLLLAGCQSAEMPRTDSNPVSDEKNTEVTYSVDEARAAFLQSHNDVDVNDANVTEATVDGFINDITGGEGYPVTEPALCGTGPLADSGNTASSDPVLYNVTLVGPQGEGTQDVRILESTSAAITLLDNVRDRIEGECANGWDSLRDGFRTEIIATGGDVVGDNLGDLDIAAYRTTTGGEYQRGTLIARKGNLVTAIEVWSNIVTQGEWDLSATATALADTFTDFPADAGSESVSAGEEQSADDVIDCSSNAPVDEALCSNPAFKKQAQPACDLVSADGVKTEAYAAATETQESPHRCLVPGDAELIDAYRAAHLEIDGIGLLGDGASVTYLARGDSCWAETTYWVDTDNWSPHKITSPSLTDERFDNPADATAARGCVGKP